MGVTVVEAKRLNPEDQDHFLLVARAIRGTLFLLMPDANDALIVIHLAKAMIEKELGVDGSAIATMPISTTPPSKHN